LRPNLALFAPVNIGELWARCLNEKKLASPTTERLVTGGLSGAAESRVPRKNNSSTAKLKAFRDTYVGRPNNEI